jgi:ribosomal protein L24E
MGVSGFGVALMLLNKLKPLQGEILWEFGNVSHCFLGFLPESHCFLSFLHKKEFFRTSSVGEGQGVLMVKHQSKTWEKMGYRFWARNQEKDVFLSETPRRHCPSEWEIKRKVHVVPLRVVGVHVCMWLRGTCGYKKNGPVCARIQYPEPLDQMSERLIKKPIKLLLRWDTPIMCFSSTFSLSFCAYPCSFHFKISQSKDISQGSFVAEFQRIIAFCSGICLSTVKFWNETNKYRWRKRGKKLMKNTLEIEW